MPEIAFMLALKITHTLQRLVEYRYIFRMIAVLLTELPVKFVFIFDML